MTPQNNPSILLAKAPSTTTHTLDVSTLRKLSQVAFSHGSFHSSSRLSQRPPVADEPTTIHLNNTQTHSARQAPPASNKIRTGLGQGPPPTHYPRITSLHLFSHNDDTLPNRKQTLPSSGEGNLALTLPPSIPSHLPSLAAHTTSKVKRTTPTGVTAAGCCGKNKLASTGSDRIPNTDSVRTRQCF